MKRWALRIVSCLVLGCVTTVAVAWGCVQFGAYDVWWEERLGELSEPNIMDSTRVEGRFHYRGLGSWRVERAHAEIGDTRRYILSWEQRDEAAPWLRDSAELPPTVVRIREGRGWPMLALAGGFDCDQSAYDYRATAIEWAVLRPGDDPGGVAAHDDYYSRVFPLRPIWPGFAMDTLFYAVIWFGIFFGVGSARRAIRKKRGRCPKCNYDLRGELDNGCSECGWGRAG